jgi:hypothetical protein
VTALEGSGRRKLSWSILSYTPSSLERIEENIERGALIMKPQQLVIRVQIGLLVFTDLHLLFEKE